MKKNIFMLLVAVMALSCASDSGSDSDGDVMDYYTSTTVITQNNVVSNYSVQGNISGNKLISVVGQALEGEINNSYEYENGLLTGIDMSFENVKFYYDAQQRLVGYAWSYGDGSHEYRRFVYLPDNIVYSESLTDMYTNNNAEITKRYILILDADHNIIQAGADENLDGVMDEVNTYTWNHGDLTSMTLYNGNTVNFTYSGVVNNFGVLYDHSYGKKMRRMIYASQYANGYSRADHSRHLSQNEFESAQYTVMNNGYYKARHQVVPFMDGWSDTTVKFFF